MVIDVGGWQRSRIQRLRGPHPVRLSNGAALPGSCSGLQDTNSRTPKPSALRCSDLSSILDNLPQFAPNSRVAKKGGEQTMDLRKLKTLIELVESSGIAELEIEEGEERVRITRAVAPSPTSTVVLPATLPATAAAGIPVSALPAVPVSPVEAEGHQVKSPMVGTFYRAASPGAKPFVRSEIRSRSATPSASSRR